MAFSTNSSFSYDYLVFIGRFQPFHNGHMQVVKEALKLSRRLIILTGSANVSRNPRNSWLANERQDMMMDAFTADPSIESDRIAIGEIDDFPYSNTGWIAQVQKRVDSFVQDVYGDDPAKEHIGLIGFSKDSSTSYLKMFPGWSLCNVPTQFKTLNASDIREQYLTNFWRIPDHDHVPEAVAQYMRDFTNEGQFKWLVDYRNADLKTIREYGPGPHMTADPVVIQSGHVLLIERAFHPGKGQLALPGGHLELDETLEQCAIRELREESAPADEKGELPPGMLRSLIDPSKTRLFDDPYRSTCGRLITQAFLFKIPDSSKMLTFTGGSDAKNPKMVPIGTLESTTMYHDHFHIIKHMAGV
jgi:bifunctional NMN adenylyltransferase/nudix hydrolase